MDYSNSNTEALIRKARQERSEAMAKLLLGGWTHLTQWAAQLLHHQPQHHGHLTHS